MARRRKRVTRRTTTRRRRTTRRRSSSRPTRRLAGFTKAGKSFALVFKTGKKLSLGKGRFKTKKSLMAAATKFRR